MEYRNIFWLYLLTIYLEYINQIIFNKVRKMWRIHSQKYFEIFLHIFYKKMFMNNNTCTRKVFLSIFLNKKIHRDFTRSSPPSSYKLLTTQSLMMIPSHTDGLGCLNQHFMHECFQQNAGTRLCGHSHAQNRWYISSSPMDTLSILSPAWLNCLLPSLSNFLSGIKVLLPCL